MVELDDPGEDREEADERNPWGRKETNSVGQSKMIGEGRFGRVEEVAQVALMLAANEYMTGSTVVVDGGLIYQ